MKNIELIKYRLKYNDVELKNRIKLILYSTLLVLILPTFILLKPFSNLKNLLIYQSQIYQTENSEVNYFKDINTLYKNTETIDISTLPIPGSITSGYGMRTSPYYGMHTGIDIVGIHHDNIRTIENGIVTFAGTQDGYGYCIEIKHDNYFSFYAHLSQINVNIGDTVYKGDIIGIEGGDPVYDPNPGISTGHHLHFEIRTSSGTGHDIDPTLYIWK